MNTVITICAVYLALTTLINAKKKEDELQLVIEISRHGARAPGKIFPFAKNPEHNYHRPSQLTYLGKKQHYDLGMYLRKKYIEDLKFLTPNYDEREVYV